MHLIIISQHQFQLLNSNSKTTSKISLWRRSGGRNFVPFSFAVGLFFVFAASLVAQVYPTKLGDLNVDGVVNGADLGLLLGAWGVCPGAPGCTGDLNNDGVVNGADLGLLLGAWGICP